MMKSLPDLPVELQSLICDHCTPETLASLCLTSKHFLTITRPALYRHVTIHYRGRTPGEPPQSQEEVQDTYVLSDASYERFRATVVNCPPVFGSLVKSLELGNHFMDRRRFNSKGSILESLGSLLSVLPNLARLKIWILRPDDELDKALFYASPSLRAFSAISWAHITPDFLAFLQSHPQLREWHTRWINDGTISPEGKASATVPQIVLERITMFATSLHPRPLMLLGQMTNLTHLCLRHYSPTNLRGQRHITITDELQRSELNALRGCGRNLVSLDLSDVPISWGSPIPWTVNQVLPLTPALRYLRVGQDYVREDKPGSPLLQAPFTREPLKRELFTAKPATLPQNLRLMVVDLQRSKRVRFGPVRREYPGSAALLRTGLKDAMLLGSLMSSLEEFGCYCYLLRRVGEEWVDDPGAPRRSDDDWGAGGIGFD